MGFLLGVDKEKTGQQVILCNSTYTIVVITQAPTHGSNFSDEIREDKHGRPYGLGRTGNTSMVIYPVGNNDIKAVFHTPDRTIWITKAPPKE